MTNDQSIVIRAKDGTEIDLTELREKIEHAKSTAKTAQHCLIVDRKTFQPTEEMNRVHFEATMAQRELLAAAVKSLEPLLDALVAALSAENHAFNENDEEADYHRGWNDCRTMSRVRAGVVERGEG